MFDECVEVRSHQIQTYSQTKTGPLLSQIEEQIPVNVCTRQILDDKREVLLERGPVFRKEGEKRRRKIGEEEGRKCLSEDHNLKAQNVAEAEAEIRRDISRLFPCMEATYPYAIKNQRKARNAPSRGLYVL